MLWRDHTTAQIGIDEHTARCLPGITTAELRALRGLDGTRSLERVLDDFAETGGDRNWLAAAVRELLIAGAIVDASEPTHDAPEAARLAPDFAALSLERPGAASIALARRQGACVHVRGTGRVGAGVASLLAAAGLGGVRISPIVGDSVRVLPRTVGPLGPRAAAVGQAARNAVCDAVAATTFAPVRSAEQTVPTLVVLCPPRALTPEAVEALTDSDLAHLLVTCDGPLARVGPLVVPGVTPCLRCLDLHRADRDPAWPLLLTQVAHERGTHRTATGTVLAAAAAAMAALHALALIDQPDTPPACAGALLELRLPSLNWTRRAWPVHPDCGCQWSPDPRAA